MKQHRGIWLPDYDEHFAGHLDKGPIVHGGATYQYNKLAEGIKFCKQRRVAIDVGAHVGLWSRVLAHEFNVVVAWEPVLDHIECFKRNLTVKTGRSTRVILHETALGDSDRRVHVELIAGNSGNAHIVLDGGVRSPEIPTALMRTLDSYIFDHHLGIDFMKIDVEGFESFVVKGGKNTILRYKPVMVVEQKKGHGERYGISDRAAVDLLCSWGAREAWVRNGDYCLVW